MIVAVFIGFPFHFGEFFELRVEFGERHGHFSARHRLAEKVIHLQVAFQGLAGLIIGFIGFQHQIEFRQDIAFDRDGFFRHIRADQRPDFVNALIEFRG